jgi:hypothetical protein
MLLDVVSGHFLSAFDIEFLYEFHSFMMRVTYATFAFT